MAKNKTKLSEMNLPKNEPEPRKGWEVSFKLMHENGDDKLLIDDIFEDEKLEEWD